MFNVNNIINTNREVNEQASHLNGMARFEAKYLPEEGEKVLIGALDEIRELSAKIEHESGWRYNGVGFVFYSNYIYNAYKEQIEFIENEVDFKNGEIVPKHNVKRELDFAATYQEDLQKMAIATARRNSLEGLAYAYMSLEFDSDEDKKKPTEVKIEARPATRLIRIHEDLVAGELAASRFYNAYGNDGLVLLIKWLNRLGNAEKPSDVFEEILGEDVPEDMKKDTLFWVSLFSTAGRELDAKYRESAPKQIVTEEQKGK